MNENSDWEDGPCGDDADDLYSPYYCGDFESDYQDMIDDMDYENHCGEGFNDDEY